MLVILKAKMHVKYRSLAQNHINNLASTAKTTEDKSVWIIQSPQQRRPKTNSLACSKHKAKTKRSELLCASCSKAKTTKAR